MVSTDPIADMLTRIRNSLAVNQNHIELPYSNIKKSVAQILAQNNYIVSVSEDGEGVSRKLQLVIKTDTSGSPITEIKRVSKPGRRVYAKFNEIPRVKQGRGLVIVSTSKGIMSGDEARSAHLGGEVLCQVY